MIKVWNKIDKINGVDAEFIISSHNIKSTDQIFLVVDENSNRVTEIQFKDIIASNYKIDNSLSCEEVGNEYLRLKLLEEEESQKNKITLEEQANKISILEAENADLLLDSAIKDSKIQTLENDLADLTLEIAMMEVR